MFETIIALLVAALIFQAWRNYDTTNSLRNMAKGLEEQNDTQADQLKKSIDKIQALQNELDGANIRTASYGDFLKVNEDYKKIIIGMKNHLQTSDEAPFGRYTHKFNSISELVLFLMFVANPADFRRNEK